MTPPGVAGARQEEAVLPASQLEGTGTFRFTIEDLGDAIYERVVLIDRIHVS